MKNIPRVPPTTDKERQKFDEAVKESIELLTGRRGGRVEPLPSDAALEAVIAKVNEIVEKMR